MLKIYIPFFYILIFAQSVYGRSNLFPSGARAAGMGNAFICRYEPAALFHNQAGLSRLEFLTLLAGCENRFGIKELSQPLLGIILPTRSGVFAFHCSSFGPPGWLETNASLAFSKTVLPNFSAGLQFNYFGNILPEENTLVSTIGFEGGVIWQVSPVLTTGLHIANPWSLPVKTRSYTETIPLKLRGGAELKMQNGFLVSAEAEFTENFPANLKAGVEWEAVKGIFFRLGGQTLPAQLSAGVGFPVSIMQFDLALQFHQRLGCSTYASVTVHIR